MKQYKRILNMFFIILAGEAIFMLPFMIPRLYRPLIIDAWGFTNTEIGLAFFTYGITATISYFLGGPFADKYHPRVLISSSLILTAICSLFLIQWPTQISLIVTYGFYGVSTILFMWGALIKTAHLVGGNDQRSTAMGILDSGRGLTAAIASSILIFLVSNNISDLENAQQQLRALNIIYFSVVFYLLLVAIGIWISLKDFVAASEVEQPWELHKALESLKNPKLWLLSIIVLSAYCGYKSIDLYSIYLVDVHKQDLTNSSKFTAIILWLRPLSTLAAGIIADKIHNKNSAGRFLFLFVLLLCGGILQFALSYAHSVTFYYAFAVILISATFAYALRALYFSVFGELKIQTNLIGTTIGIVSFVGFLPDVFYGYVTGYFIDNFQGVIGYQYSFRFTATCLIIGALSSSILYHQQKNR